MVDLILLCGSGGDDYDKKMKFLAPFLHSLIHCDFTATITIIVSELQNTNIDGNKQKARLLCQLLTLTEFYNFHQQVAKHQSSAASC
jgi:hypothetical protein